MLYCFTGSEQEPTGQIKNIYIYQSKKLILGAFDALFTSDTKSEKVTSFLINKKKKVPFFSELEISIVSLLLSLAV